MESNKILYFQQPYDAAAYDAYNYENYQYPEVENHFINYFIIVQNSNFDRNKSRWMILILHDREVFRNSKFKMNK